MRSGRGVRFWGMNLRDYSIFTIALKPMRKDPSIRPVKPVQTVRCASRCGLSRGDNTAFRTGRALHNLSRLE